MSKRTTLDNFYHRESFMYGGGWISYERGVAIGDVRLINETLSVAWQVRRRLWPFKHQILWASVKPEALRKVDISEQP